MSQIRKAQHGWGRHHLSNYRLLSTVLPISDSGARYSLLDVLGKNRGEVCVGAVDDVQEQLDGDGLGGEELGDRLDRIPAFLLLGGWWLSVEVDGDGDAAALTLGGHVALVSVAAQVGQGFARLVLVHASLVLQLQASGGEVIVIPQLLVDLVRVILACHILGVLEDLLDDVRAVGEVRDVTDRFHVPNVVAFDVQELILEAARLIHDVVGL